MEIRRVEFSEYFDSDMVSRTCFHERFTGDEAEERAKPRVEREDWGAFNEDGALMAHIINNHFEARLNGKWVSMGGVGAVSTLPEYRNSGAIRQVFRRMLPECVRRGEVISALYPFKHSFYRKFGYETVANRNIFEFRPAALRAFRFGGKAKQFERGQDVGEYLRIHERFIQNYNLTVRRDVQTMQRRFLLDQPLSERKFAYLLSQNGENTAYVCFTDQRHDPAARLIVTDLAWTEPAGLGAILGFLARFEADYGAIELPLPTDVNLRLLVPDAYEIEEAKLTASYMLRVIDVPKALETLCAYVREGFSLSVYGDGMIPENNGAWFVDESGVKPFGGQADIEVSLCALNQLICGAVDFKNALFRPDVRVNAKVAVLESVFRARPAVLTDHF